jgi:hypothetical protein
MRIYDEVERVQMIPSAKNDALSCTYIYPY